MPHRSLLIALALAALVTAPARAATTVVPDTTGILTPWTIAPQHPCTHDSVFIVVRGFQPTSCIAMLQAYAIDPTHVRIVLEEHDDIRCFTGPTQFFPVPIRLGFFTAGVHPLDIEVVTRHVQGDSSATETAAHYADSLVVDSQCPTPPPPPQQILPPYVDGIGTDPPAPCATRPTNLVLSGHFPNSCGEVIDSETINSENVHLTVKVGSLPDTGCAMFGKPWNVAFPLGTLPPGPHHVAITMVVYSVDSTGTTYRAEVFQTSDDFTVLADCSNVPPGPLPFVQAVYIGPNAPWTTPICEGDSIPVLVKGLFPNTCFVFRKIELVTYAVPTVGPVPPPLVRITVDDRACLGIPCADHTVPWSVSAMLPPLTAWNYKLPVEVVYASCADTVHTYRADFPFSVVAPPCPPRCVTGTFPRTNDAACNASVSPGHPGHVTFAVRPQVALAGLQGTFHLSTPGLAITHIEAIGAAAGMNINWQTTADGAKFVLFAASGAPIPPFQIVDAWGDPSAGVPVVRVTVEQTQTDGVPERSLLAITDLLGADAHGVEVPSCPMPRGMDPLPPALGPSVAIICSGGVACDFNIDGRENVVDLVLMAHCVTHEGPCPDSLQTLFDCNGDGQFSLADVICCSSHMLQRPPCNACPPDTGGRPEPGIRVSFGDAVAAGGDVGLPIHIEGADRIGAAMLTLRAPLERYAVMGIDGGPDWLAIPEERNGQLMLGLINLAGGRLSVSRTGAADIMLNLRLRAEQTPGGEVAAVAGEFSGPDGVVLTVNLGSPVGTIPGGRLDLSAGRPNPFSTEARFTVTLPEKANAEIGVYDLRGRAVATLHHGPLAAGPTEFTWDGRRDDGSAAASGVYFYRARVAGQVLARKLILMRGN
jgi:hypothetical protein